MTDPAHIPVRSKDGGYITQLLDELLRSFIATVKSSYHRLAYGSQNRLGTDNQFVYNTALGKWTLRDGGDVESGVPPVHPGDALSPPRTISSHVDHPYCSSKPLNPVLEPTPFAGVFKRTEQQASSQSGSLSGLDLSTLSHPVYAPRGRVLAHDSLPHPVVATTATVRVIKTSPFS